jgi:hypothetical protein
MTERADRATMLARCRARREWCDDRLQRARRSMRTGRVTLDVDPGTFM